MKNYNIIATLILLFVCLPVLLIIKLKDLGMSKKVILATIVSFPIQYISGLRMIILTSKKIEKRKRIAFIFEVGNPANLFMINAKANLLVEAQFQAIKEMVPKLSKPELNAFAKILMKEDVVLSVKRKKIKRIEQAKKRPKSITVEVLQKIFSDKIFGDKVFLHSIGNSKYVDGWFLCHDIFNNEVKKKAYDIKEDNISMRCS